VAKIIARSVQESGSMAKGTSYELKVRTLVEAQINNGSFGIDPKLAKVRHKPPYYSQDRKKDILFDVSIELYRKGVALPYWIWIWECKDYNHPVPVDDVEEFHAKLDQVGADRTKGTMITPIGFDTGGVEFARTHGIGLWRWIPPGSPCSLMEGRETGVGELTTRGLTEPDTGNLPPAPDLYALTTDGQFLNDNREVLHREIGDVR
jgi:hypothetical protein